MTEKVLKIAEVARFLRISTRHVYRLKGLPFFCIGEENTHRRYLLSQVINWAKVQNLKKGG